MALTDGDRIWLQNNFDKVHERINDTNETVSQLRTDFEVAQAGRCSDIVTHERDHHTTRMAVETTGIFNGHTKKILAILAGLVALATSLAAIIAKNM